MDYFPFSEFPKLFSEHYGFYSELKNQLNEREDRKGESKEEKEDKREKRRKPELNSQLHH